MDGGETDTAPQGAGGVESSTTASSDGADDLAVEEYGGSGAAVVVAVCLKRPRTPRPARRRAVVRRPGAAGSEHAARRTKEFVRWREWYLRKQRRERDKARLCYVGIPPPTGG